MKKKDELDIRNLNEIWNSKNNITICSKNSNISKEWFAGELNEINNKIKNEKNYFILLKKYNIILFLIKILLLYII